MRLSQQEGGREGRKHNRKDIVWKEGDSDPKGERETEKQRDRGTEEGNERERGAGRGRWRYGNREEEEERGGWRRNGTRHRQRIRQNT